MSTGYRWKPTEEPQRTNLVLSSPALRNAEQNSEQHSKWIKLVKTARNTFASATKSTATSNRFAELRENEWLNDDDASNKDIDENEKDVQEKDVHLVVNPLKKPDRRSNVIAEQNLELNSSSDYRKVSNSSTKWFKTFSSNFRRLDSERPTPPRTSKDWDVFLALIATIWHTIASQQLIMTQISLSFIWNEQPS